MFSGGGEVETHWTENGKIATILQEQSDWEFMRWPIGFALPFSVADLLGGK